MFVSLKPGSCHLWLVILGIFRLLGHVWKQAFKKGLPSMTDGLQVFYVASIRLHPKWRCFFIHIFYNQGFLTCFTLKNGHTSIGWAHLNFNLLTTTASQHQPMLRQLTFSAVTDFRSWFSLPSTTWSVQCHWNRTTSKLWKMGSYFSKKTPTGGYIHVHLHVFDSI